MLNTRLDPFIKPYLSKFPFIRAIMIADREEGFDVYEYNDDGVKEGLIFNESAGGVQAVRHTLADIFKAIQTQIQTLGMGRN